MTPLEHDEPPSAVSQPLPAEPSKGWASVCALALAAFIFNTTEFVPVGLLENIGASFDMPASAVGVMFTVYAWVVACASLPMMLLTARMDRRRLLLAVFGVFVAAHALAVVAGNFGLLLASRVGVALAHAVFWSITAALAVRLAPAGRQAQALALIGVGSTMAMVLGVPLGRVVGDALGWKMSFALIAAVALGVMVALAVWLPALPSRNAGSASSVLTLLQRGRLRWLYALLLTVVTAQFMVYSYVEPLMQTLAALPAQVTTGVLVCSGAAGLLGSVLFGRYGQRYAHGFLLMAVGALALCLAVLMPVAMSDGLWLVVPSSWPFATPRGWPIALYACAVCWGTAMLCMALSIQAHVLQLAHDATDVGTALFSGIFNVGIGSGALVGSFIIAQGGLVYLSWAACALAVLAWVAYALGQQR